MKAILTTGPLQSWASAGLSLSGLSLWFMCIFTIVFVCGAIYGASYMKHYSGRTLKNALHWINYAIAYASMMMLCVVQDCIAFLVCWEIMALSSFFLIIYESEKSETIKAGINFFIQSHISVILLTAGFMLIAARTGSTSFSAIPLYCSNNNGMAAFLLLAAGFAVKAGFIPFHTWLPYAHPAAPAHISGVMSGVIIKIGIFGILKMISLFTIDFVTAGAIILAFSAISGLYGVMMAILQHNLKKLLAYHSIENIGIIGMGIGLGCIGAGNGNAILASLGFGGALIHTLNHALFKSVLFFCSGNVYHATHTLNIEKLGGLGKKMPWTAALFLIASIAICGLPPLNGFISEFLIYNGLFGWLRGAEPGTTTGALFCILALVMIGGLAILCFTKAFGIIFLGSPRTDVKAREMEPCRIVPLAAEALIMLSIGLCPGFYARLADGALRCLPCASTGALAFGMGGSSSTAALTSGAASSALAGLGPVGLAGVIFLLLAVAIFAAKSAINSKRTVSAGPTWGCGYTEGTARIQYTASSFAKTYVKLFSFVLGNRRNKRVPKELYPREGHFETITYDKLERTLIDSPLKAYRSFMDRFSFLQNGKMQFYVLYGIIFIISTLIITFIAC